MKYSSLKRNKFLTRIFKKSILFAKRQYYKRLSLEPEFFISYFGQYTLVIRENNFNFFKLKQYNYFFGTDYVM